MCAALPHGDPLMSTTDVIEQQAATPEEDDLFESARMSFGDHLEELRACLIRAIAGVFIAMCVCLLFGRSILLFLCKPLFVVQFANGLTPNLQVLSPTAGFTAYLKIAMLSGVILAMPWVLHQVWTFVAAGLYPHERRAVKRFMPISVGLFVLGAAFLYYIVLPIALQFFVTFNKKFDAFDLTPTAFQSLVLGTEEQAGTVEESEPLPASIPVLTKDPKDPKPGDMWVSGSTRTLKVRTKNETLSMQLAVGDSPPLMQSQFAIDFYMSFVLMLMLAFGVAFETPIVVTFLVWTGITPAPLLERSRRYVLFAMVVLAAVFTPPDVISQVLLAGPMYALFEIGLLAGKRLQARSTTEGA